MLWIFLRIRQEADNIDSWFPEKPVIPSPESTLGKKIINVFLDILYIWRLYET